jgi:predicted nucleic acid-binding protein
MPAGKLLVLDANILIRAVLGPRVRTILTDYGATAQFIAPESAVSEAHEHLPAILSRRGNPVTAGFAVLDAVMKIVQTASPETYAAFEETAKRRIAKRDIDDWPVIAAALAFKCPIWTEDADFFGAGVATWTTDRVELFLGDSS